MELDIFGRKIQVPLRENIFSEGNQVLLVIRPESVELEPAKPDTLSGKVLESVYIGSQMIYEIGVKNTLLTVEIANPQEHKAFAKGEEVTITLKENSLAILPYEENENRES